MDVNEYKEKLERDLRYAIVHMKQNPGKVDSGHVVELQRCIQEIVMWEIHRDREIRDAIA